MRRGICTKFYNNQKRVDFFVGKNNEFSSRFFAIFQREFSQLYNVIYIQDHSRLSFDKLACEIANLLHKFRIVYHDIIIIHLLALYQQIVQVFPSWLAITRSDLRELNGHLNRPGPGKLGIGGKGQRSTLKSYSADISHGPFETRDSITVIRSEDNADYIYHLCGTARTRVS